LGLPRGSPLAYVALGIAVVTIAGVRLYKGPMTFDRVVYRLLHSKRGTRWGLALSTVLLISLVALLMLEGRLELPAYE
jgi:hypothetical protein